MPQPSYAPGIAIPSRRDVETQPAQPTEQLSAIHEMTVKTLYEANAGLDHLLRKMRGSCELEGGVSSDKVAERHAVSDAYLMRGLAGDVLRKVSELHNIIGHDK